MRAVARRGGNDDPLNELYAAPLKDWVARRNAIVERLRGAGREHDAKALARVPKPKATIWAINRTARSSPRSIQRLISAADALKAAQLRAPAKMAAAARDFRDATEAIAHDAIAAMKEGGLNTSLDSHRRIANTLRGAATAARGSLLEGRLTDEIAPAGFDLFAGTAPRGRQRLRTVATKQATAPAASRERERPAREDLARRRAAQLEAEAGSRAWDAEQASDAVAKARTQLRELEAKARVASHNAARSRRLAERARTRAGRAGR